ncbi:MAG: putative membrane protein, partial [Kiritimatiellia bacterium]
MWRFAERPMRAERVVIGVLALFIVLGIALRFVALDHQIFWHDEVYSRFFAAGYQAADWKPALFTGEILD